MRQSIFPFSPRCIALATVAAGTLVQAAPDLLLPLKPGTYVVSSYKPCEEAPLAGVMVFDGKAFAGPHESSCSSAVVSRHGKTYDVVTECRAHGDGTPQTPTKWSQSMRLESSSSFAVTVNGQPVRYDLCTKFR